MERFEELFKTKAQGPALDLLCPKSKGTQRAAAKVTLLEANRAKNLAITLRKAGRGPEEICRAIHTWVPWGGGGVSRGLEGVGWGGMGPDGVAWGWMWGWGAFGVQQGRMRCCVAGGLCGFNGVGWGEVEPGGVQWGQTVQGAQLEGSGVDCRTVGLGGARGVRAQRGWLQCSGLSTAQWVSIARWVSTAK